VQVPEVLVLVLVLQAPVREAEVQVPKVLAQVLVLQALLPESEVQVLVSWLILSLPQLI